MPASWDRVMGLVFDIRSAQLYSAWSQSPQGRAMEKSVEGLLKGLLDPQPGERVLDIGCGFGDHLLFLNQLGLDISGVDASPYMLSRAKERLGHQCSLQKGKAEDLPFEDNEFDLAVLINTLEFLDDPLQALREAGRVTNRRIFIGVMNSLSWLYLRSKLQGFFRESLLKHVRFYHLWQLKAYIQAAFGPVPLTWGSSQLYPPLIGRGGIFTGSPWNLGRWPIGSLLGLQIDIVYSLKTENLSLKLGLEKTKQSTADGFTRGSMNSVKKD
jgi:SAM-dependent methyltransferase